VTPGTLAAGRIPYAGLGLDRAGDRRADPDWVAGLAAGPRAVVRPMWNDECLVAAGEPLVLPAEGWEAARLVLLGLAGDVPTFAADLSELSKDAALARTGADGTADIRALFTGLPADEAATLAFARGLLRWHRFQQYCGRCGSPAEPRDGGHFRACTNSGCAHLLFPRIEPAVITLVESAAEPRRCLLAKHRASKLGGYSLLAGFVEVGESLEDAVRREIREEAGIALTRVDYVGSQPWPFPAGLMVGFRAVTADETTTADGDEILEARWFTRERLREYAEETHRLGRDDSIDRLILNEWLAEK
jgi:NAD+ diphosphatase